MSRERLVDVLIVTALSKERDAIIHYCDKCEKVEGEDYYEARVNHENSETFYKVILICSGMGSEPAAIEITKALMKWHPRTVILTGIAGGVRDAENRLLGDVIIATQIVGYDIGKKTDSGIENRHEVMRASYPLLSRIEDFKPGKWALDPRILSRPDGKKRCYPKAHTGVIASGNRVIADSTTTPELQAYWSKLVGLEMEAYGSALAVERADNPTQMLMIKSICDWTGPDKNDDWQDYSCSVAAAYVINFLQSKPFAPKSVASSTLKNSAKAISPSQLTKEDFSYLIICLDESIYSERDYRKSLCGDMGITPRSLGEIIDLPGTDNFSKRLIPHLVNTDHLKAIEKLVDLLMSAFHGEKLKNLTAIKRKLENQG
jgi:nucleoside phosphorylase